ncbi:carbonic anhydrase [Desulfopila sp. IMCC35006]|uniref:carbonic anhydrase n=1 Tax=Desulfopila sp. IMCC35006 TaxID=2569542 RepID=UPI0010AC1D10|nr:carbonic anhydrase [Desulfopila sp. IMCC35006]TKB24653.1 carbonic anhydrase [Desulfopila sp. IMCC35006]
MFRKIVMRVVVIAFGLGVVFTAGLALSSPAGGKSVPPDEALQKLMDGNKHFVNNKLTNAARSDAATRASLATSQKPYAIILSCSDSRVPPEIIFDKGLGEIFVIRVAGNIPDPIVLGSIEYAAEHLGSTLIMVLGHERCGAVTATVDAKGQSTGSKNIDAIVKEIEPNIGLAADDCEACKGEKDCAATKKSELVNCVIDTNAKTVAANLIKNSNILNHLVEEKKIKIVAARYDLDDGKVALVE